MSGDEPNFSERFGYRPRDAEVSIRETAPEEVRTGLMILMRRAGLGPEVMRQVVCDVVLRRPDPNNWSPGNVEREARDLVDNAPWYAVYDIAERAYQEARQGDFEGNRQANFQNALNQLFRQLGVGWEMVDGFIVARGSEAFAVATRSAADTMREAGAPTASLEIHEALSDISRRPSADVTGAIQHAMAALECVAREIDGSTDTLGKIIGRLPLPSPLDTALHKLWGFASEQGRHIREGREPKFEEAELVVTVAAAVSVYLLRFRSRVP